MEQSNSLLNQRKARNKAVYEEIRQFKTGEQMPSPFLRTLAAWFQDEFGVNLVNLRWGTTEGKHSNDFWILLYVNNQDDWQKMHTLLQPSNKPTSRSKHIEKLITRQFKTVAAAQGILNNQSTNAISIRVENFFWIAKELAHEHVSDAFFSQIQAENSQIWRVIRQPFAIFYYLENQLEDNQKNGRNQAILERYYEEIKRFDEVNYITRENLGLIFDSKENLDSNYQGNLGFYFG